MNFVDDQNPVQLYSVTMLKAVVEVLKELIEGSSRLIGKLGEDEGIGLVAHISEPRRHGVERLTPAS